MIFHLKVRRPWVNKKITLHILIILLGKLELHWTSILAHDDVIKWKHFPRYWPFVREIHRSPVNSPHKGQWRGALMFPLICARINGWANNLEAGDLRRHRAHYDVSVMYWDANLILLEYSSLRISHAHLNIGQVTMSSLSKSWRL